MNKVMLIGNLTKEPEVRATSTGLKTVSFSMAINDGKDKNGQDQVQYFNLTAFDKQADVIEKYVKKGHKIMVVGRLKNRSWDKPDGTKGYATDITVSELELLTSKADADRLSSMPQTAPTQGSTQPTVAKNNDLPEIDINSMNVSMPF
jgi:single-strand DNA-binding protein